MASIPLANKWVRIKEIHPKMQYRLQRFFADPHIKGKVVVSSGVRTYAQQKELYRRYKAGTFPNLVANPDRKFGGGFQGSWHMQQPNHPEGSYGFAVDFRIVGKISTTEVNAIAREYGLWRTVPSEWWHHQAYGYDGRKYAWFPAPAVDSKQEAKVTTVTNIERRSVFDEIANAMKTTLRKGARGQNVRLLQSRLADKGYRLSRSTVKKSGIDGHFGNWTLKALKQFQRKEGLVVDGICGPNTWKALMK